MVGDEFLAQGLHLKSHQSYSAGIRTWLSADLGFLDAPRYDTTNSS